MADKPAQDLATLGSSQKIRLRVSAVYVQYMAEMCILLTQFSVGDLDQVGTGFFSQIRILKRTMADRGSIFQPSN
jgi:hypothetical protein